MKTRITISLDPNTVKELDKLVDGEVVFNRSYAVEKMLKERLSPKSVRKAFILAGGQGIRMRPITYELPKVMLPIKGKPLLEYTIKKLKEWGVDEIIISIGYLGNKIRDHFGDGANFGTKIKYVEEIEPLGTGGPLKLAARMLEEDFFMINGDTLFDFDLETMYKQHKKNRPLATIALTSSKEVSRFGAIEMEGNHITNFIEKPKGDAGTNLVNAGVYVINPLLLSFIPDGKSSIEETFEKIARKGKLEGFVFSGKWLPCDNVTTYEKAIKELA